MGLFSKKTKDVKPEEKKVEEKTSKVVGEKKAEKKVETKKVETKSTKDLYTEDKKVEKTSDVRSEKRISQAFRVLVRPMITEKATTMSAEDKFVFEVSLKTNKIEVAKAIEEVYGIKPIAVNIVRMQGKKVTRGKVSGKRKDWKKAIVTLPKGKSIQIYEGV